MRFPILIFLLFSLTCAAQSNFKYNLTKPVISYQLPPILNEVSGLTDLSPTQVACVQDEIGTAFIYDFKNGKIVSEHHFDSIGDFEGLTSAGSTLYILRSDGRLTEWNNFPRDQKSIIHHNLPVTTANNEGLCHDPKHNRLLIAAKSKPRNHDRKSERFIYSFDLASRKLADKPAYILNVDDISSRAADFNIEQNILNKKGEKKAFNFRPSSVAIHPLSDDIYVLSAEENLLLVMDRNGKIKHMEPLSRAMFPKAEGITFLADGTMIITNETGGKSATLLVFQMN